ncbi:MAG: response regulator transcription factor [Slackia sp.]|nr:response regulator transcription factor [Slackia sp.]
MIYYLEDDEQIRNLTLYTLAQTGHETRGFSCAAELYDALADATPDLFILDVMLPGEDGISVLKKLRERSDTEDVPVMMLTAKSTEFDTVCGLDAGADDYLAKPFGMMELLSRVNALLRRARRNAEQARKAAEAARAEAASESAAACDAGDVMEAGPIRLDAARYAVTVSGTEVRLTHKEFEMLRFLMRNRGIVVSRGQLLDQVWGYEVAGETRTVDAHVQTLRKKLSEVDAEAAAFIETVRGVGYRMRG